MTHVDYLIMVGPILGTILFVFGMKYISIIFQARARVANDAQYRELAESVVAAQAQLEAVLSAMQTELSTITKNLTAVEKILQQVE